MKVPMYLLLFFLYGTMTAQGQVERHTAYRLEGPQFHRQLPEENWLVERNRGYMTDTSTLIGLDWSADTEPAAMVKRSEHAVITQSVEGITSSFLRSDNTIAVGPNHVVQVINSYYLSSLVRVWDKAGNILIDKAQFRDLTGDYDYGDPNIIYDWEADRFVITFLFGEWDNKLIIAVSETNDPTGNWYGYTFITPGGFPDYEKLGRWGDSYVVTVAAVNPAVYLLNRNQILTGAAEVDALSIPLPRIPNNPWQAVSPIHQTGYEPLPEGAPIAVARVVEGSYFPEDSVEDHMEIFEISADWSTVSAVVSDAIHIEVEPFDHNVCDTITPNACLEQPESDVKIWPCQNFLMDKPQMVVRDGRIHAVCTHVVNTSITDTTAAMRWYEVVRNESGSWELSQSNTYSPDGLDRFMGSVSINEQGDIVLGYNVVSEDEYPGFRMAVHRSCDESGYMEGELMGAVGTAPNASNSYGDYNSLVTDPVDGSFWFSAQYNVSPKWSTRVVQVRVDSCSGTAVTAGIEDTWRVYPNPTSDWLFVELFDVGGLQLQIMDMVGREVYNKRMDGSAAIPVNSWAAGPYELLLFKENVQINSKKIMIYK